MPTPLLTSSPPQLDQHPVCFCLTNSSQALCKIVHFHTSFWGKESIDPYQILKGVYKPEKVWSQCSPKLLTKNLSESSIIHWCQIPNQSPRHWDSQSWDSFQETHSQNQKWKRWLIPKNLAIKIIHLSLYFGKEGQKKGRGRCLAGSIYVHLQSVLTETIIEAARPFYRISGLYY